MLRCAELNLSDEALSGFDMGMIYDLLTERNNDGESYAVIADQSDIERFFPK